LPSRPEKRGVGHRHERWDGERWTRRCPRAGVIAGRIYRSMSDQTAHRRTALQRTAKACGPDASAVGVKSRGGFASPTGRTKPYSRDDGVKQARSPGRARYRPLKPLRRESRIASAGPVCSCACFCTILHTRPRVQRASGFPCALFCGGQGIFLADLGRIAPREREVASRRHCEPTGRANARPMTGSAKQSTYPLAAPWIASQALAMTADRAV
jgi:hypothetical protein